MFGLKRFRIRTRYNPSIRPMLAPIFEDIDSVVVRQQFTTSPKDFIVLCEVNWNKRIDDPKSTLNNVVKGLQWFDEIIVISSDKRRTLCFAKGKYDEMFTELFVYTTREFMCFIDYPVTVRKDHGLIDMVGTPKELERLLAFMREWGSDMEVVAIKDYHTRDKGLLTVLTDKQLSVLKFAYERGFFDHPRKADARKLSGKMGLKHTTFLTHIRKSQKRMLDELFGE